MAAKGDKLQFELRLGCSSDVAESCLTELRKIQKRLRAAHFGELETFDFGVEPGILSEKSIQLGLAPLMRACIWHALGIKLEFKLKLLHSVDGYLAAVDSKNPIATFLLGRHILELAATISEIDVDLEDCAAKTLDWSRGASFLAILLRARHSSSDEKFKQLFIRHGIPSELLKVTRPGRAIKRLTSRPGFASASSIYDTLSNMCHNNGSGHKLLVENIREQKSISTPGGRKIFIGSSVAVTTMAYPSTVSAANSLGLTAQVAWWGAYCANRWIESLRESPFDESELRRLTNGRVTNIRQFFAHSEVLPSGVVRRNAAKVRRNGSCPCGSGKKYKHCCLLNSDRAAD